MVVTAKSEVPARAILEPREAIGATATRRGKGQTVWCGLLYHRVSQRTGTASGAFKCEKWLDEVAERVLKAVTLVPAGALQF